MIKLKNFFKILWKKDSDCSQTLRINTRAVGKAGMASQNLVERFFIPQLILSFSGLPELADEAIMLMLAINLGLGGESYCDKIAKISSNNIFYDLKSLYGH